MLTYELNLKLHANQKIINSSKARFLVVKAGKRFGKTKLALYRLVKRAGYYAGDTFWYLAPFRSQAKDIAWLELMKLLPRGLIKRKLETDLLIELVNGSVIHLKGCDHEETLRGPQLRAVVFDEYAYCKPYIWDSIISGQLLGYGQHSFADFISSPNKDGMNHFTNFHTEAMEKMKTDPDWAAFFFTIYDNPTISKEEIDKFKSEKPDDVWELEYMAKESPFAGPMFGDYFTSANIGEYQGKENLPVYRALDWGIDHPTACIWMKVDREAKTIYIYDEYLKSGALISESCEYIKRITGNQPVEWTVADPSLNKRNSQTQFTDMMEFNRNGVPCIPADNRDRGYDVMKMFLKKGRLVISPRCKNVIYQIKNVQRDQDVNDDCTDVCRYGVLKIHDAIGGMNIFEMEAKNALPKVYTEEMLKDIRTLRMDDFLKPQREELNNWVYEEIASPE